MRSTLTLVTPAPSYDLTILETLKRELGITNSDSDTALAELIRQASGTVSGLTKRVWAKEVVLEKFYIGGWECISTLVLKRRPISLPPDDTITVTENGNALTLDVDYTVDAEKGMLYRTSFSGFLSGSLGMPNVEVQYSGGYELLDSLPYGIERATLILAKSYWHSNTRDPSIKSETTFELDSVTYRDIGDAERQVQDLLSLYTQPSLA